MSSKEQKQILKMVEDGKISAEDAMKLIKAIEADTAEDEIEIIEAGSGTGSGFEAEEGTGGTATLEFEQVKERARRFAMIPLGIGAALTVLASYWLFVLVQAANYGFWFAFAWLPLILGILLLALSAGGMNARWLYVNVDQAPGQQPQHISLGFPVPLGLAGWLLRTFGRYVPGMDDQRVSDILSLLATTDAHGPLIVNVDESGHGERVQVYIG